MTGDVVLLATNDGSRAGAIVTGRLIVGWTSEKRQHFMSSMLWMPSDEPQIVGPGTAVIARLFIDPLLETESDTDASDARALVAPKENDDPLTAPIEKASCVLDLMVVNATGATEDDSVSARCTALHPFVVQAVQSTFR